MNIIQLLKKTEILPFATWMDLESIMLCEISQTERQILYNLTYIWNLKIQRHRNRVQVGAYQRQGVEGGELAKGGQRAQTFSYKITECNVQFSSVKFSRSVISDSLRPHESQHARPPCPSPAPGVHPNHVHWVGDTIQPSHPLSSPSSPALNLSQHQGLFQWVSSSHQVAKVLESNISPSKEHPGLISFRMYSMVAVVNNTVLYAWKLLRD